MRISVKKDLCCAAQLCVLQAPDVFRLDALGYNDSNGDDVPPGQEESARAGVEACPEEAIELIEGDAAR
jgi:ferredoxin